MSAINTGVVPKLELQISKLATKEKAVLCSIHLVVGSERRIIVMED